MEKENPTIKASIIHYTDKEKELKGKADVNREPFLKEEELIEIKVWDSKERPMIISDEHQKKLTENFNRRITSNALRIKEQIKEDIDKKIKAGKKKEELSK